MSVQSRKAVREEVGQILTIRLASLAQQVYTDQPTSFGGQSPVVVVASTGSERDGQVQRTFGGPIAPKFTLDIYLFVLAATADADDLLDSLEAAVAEFVAVYSRAQTWTAISYDGRTETRFVEVLDGSEYKQERIPLLLTGT
jgi:hypothetical protein